MKKLEITVKCSVAIKKSRQEVWDYTQDYINRAKWDHAVIEATVISNKPHRTVLLKMISKTTMTLVYKADLRPVKTSLISKEVNSSFIASAGGSWTYEDIDGGTLWTQTNTVQLKETLVNRIMFPVYKWFFRYSTVKAMETARRQVEKK